jgi:hypothetical protein
MKKNILVGAFFFLASFCSHSQQLRTQNALIDQTFVLAVHTLRKNTQDSLIKAGGTYGGEWTRDISINSWNAAGLLLPKEAEFSLWSVTNNRETIGAEYWDKIIWVIAAYNYYLVNGDRDFLRQAYVCSANTMEEMENSVFDSEYGLFKGPSVFNDGIAAYEEPVFDPAIGRSGVTDYSGSTQIKCLSSNCVYYEAYLALARMAAFMGEDIPAGKYTAQAGALKENIRKHLFDSCKGWLNYLIDQKGNLHTHQEGLGVSFAILFGIVNKEEALRIINRIYISPYGLPSVYPILKRFSIERPGRHNAMIWPFVNAFWADACYQTGRKDLFEKEFMNIVDLTVHKGKKVFYEIHNATTGEPDGGNQSGSPTWTSVPDQTWSATGFLRMVFTDLLGIKILPEGLYLSPDYSLLKKMGFIEINDVPYRSTTMKIKFTGQGNQLAAILKNGAKVENAFIASDTKQNVAIEFVFSEN